MSIKPIDFQMLIPKTVEVSKISSDSANKETALQQQQSAMIQHRAENSLKQVYNRDKTQDVRITEKQKEDRRDKKKKDKDTQNKGNDEKSNMDKRMQTSTIDIKV
jgi:hypothetical protein